MQKCCLQSIAITIAELFMDRIEDVLNGRELDQRYKLYRESENRHSLIGEVQIPRAELLCWRKKCTNERSGDNLSWKEFNGNMTEIEHCYKNIIRSEICKLGRLSALLAAFILNWLFFLLGEKLYNWFDMMHASRLSLQILIHNQI